MSMAMVPPMHQMHQRAGEQYEIRNGQQDVVQVIDKQVEADGCGDEADD